MKEKDILYFNTEKEEKNPIFFRRFPELNFNGLKILDFGCGHGALSIDLALKGAAEVTGIDLNCDLVDFANENLKTNYAGLMDCIVFKCMDLKDLADDYFDIIISKASFEHVIDLDILLAVMKNKLKMGGKIVSGFGPLYNSPWGDHNRLRHQLPWTHVIYGEKYFIEKLNRNRSEKISNLHDLGLNGYSLNKYQHIFNTVEELVVVDFRTNVSHKFAMRFFNLFTYIPFLKEFFTYNIYCVLCRRPKKTGV
jgi:2-polyprenyl-3-methyl-5-hydroxy-6-metoxy-1,4-benzoquinol methylase